MDLLDTLIGEGKDLNELQMGCRAFLVYLISLALLKISGLRTFGKRSAFDNIVAITLGAILSRCVVGASPFVPTICGSLVIVLLHRLLGWASIYMKGFGKFIKGDETVLYKDGRYCNNNLRKNLLTDGDLMESVRLNANINTLTKVDEIIMERSGQISVIKKED